MLLSALKKGHVLVPLWNPKIGAPNEKKANLHRQKFCSKIIDVTRTLCHFGAGKLNAW